MGTALGLFVGIGISAGVYWFFIRNNPNFRKRK